MGWLHFPYLCQRCQRILTLGYLRCTVIWWVQNEAVMMHIEPLSLNIIARRKNYANFSQEYEAPEQDLNWGLLKYETVVFRYWIVTFGLSHLEFLSKFSRNGFVFNCESDQNCLKLEDQKRIKQINNCKTSANCNTAEHNRQCSNNKSTNSLPFYQEIKQCCLKQ